MPLSNDQPNQPSPLIRLARHPVKFRLYLLTKIPAAFFSGLRVKEIEDNSCTVSIPYKWFTKNPFRSTYFACLSMAAEMSTGILAMALVYGHKPPVSMLVTGMQAEFFKKATGLTLFRCTDGALIKEAIRQAVATGEPRTVTARSVGTNAAGEMVAAFNITWSFKMKTSINNK